jgi:hypothetical protein
VTKIEARLLGLEAKVAVHEERIDALVRWMGAREPSDAERLAERIADRMLRGARSLYRHDVAAGTETLLWRDDLTRMIREVLEEGGGA